MFDDRGGFLSALIATFTLDELGYRRLTNVRYRPPHATSWQDLELDEAMDMIAERVIETRARTWEEVDQHGYVLNRTLGFAHLGGATLDNEENYLIKKLLTGGLGILPVENQARI